MEMDDLERLTRPSRNYKRNIKYTVKIVRTRSDIGLNKISTKDVKLDTTNKWENEKERKEGVREPMSSWATRETETNCNYESHNVENAILYICINYIS